MTQPIVVVTDQPVHIEKHSRGLKSASFWNTVAPLGLPILLVLEIMMFWLLSPDQFGTMANLKTTILSNSVLAILSLGVLVTLVTGEFDVSLSMVFTTTMLIAAILISHFGMPILLASMIAVSAATLIGVLTGSLVVLTRANSLIVSLGMMILLRGLNEALTEGSTVIVRGENGDSLRALSSSVAYGTLPVVLLIVVSSGLWYVMEMTPLGRKWHAVGGSNESAKLLGLRTDALRIGAFATGGALAGVAGILQLSASTTATASFGSGFLFPSIAAAFLGAVAFKIGTFNVRGTLAAIFVLAVGVTGIKMLGAPNWIDGLFYGTALIVAVAVVQAVWGRRQK